MLTLNAPKTPAEDNLSAFSGVVYINALELLPTDERYSHSAIALNVLLVHRLTGEELLLDLLTPADNFATVNAILKLHFPSRSWLFAESWSSTEPEATEPYAQEWYQISTYFSVEDNGWKVCASSACDEFESQEVFASPDEAIAAGDEFWRNESAYASVLEIIESWREKGLITDEEEQQFQDNSYYVC